MKKKTNWMKILFIMMLGMVMNASLIYAIDDSDTHANSKEGYNIDNPVMPEADERTANPDSDFVFNAATGEITRYKGTAADVIIPDTIGGVPVVSIGETAFNFDRYRIPVSNIQLPSTLESIGELAFGNQKFKNIIFPSGLKSIGETAFLNCLNLEEVNLPDSVQILGRAAFKQCPSIQRVVLSSRLKQIPSDCFYPTNQIGSLREVVFKEGLEEIGSSAFMGQKLKNIRLPDSIKIIDKQAFALQQEPDQHGTVYIGSSIQEIRAQAGNVGNISNAFGGWRGKIVFPFTAEEASLRGVNKILTYPGNPFQIGYASKVSYETNGGLPSSIPNEEVAYGETIRQVPEHLIKPGFLFDGWYQEEAFLIPWDFENDKVLVDMTLYAKWIPKEYTVKYDTQGGAAIPDKTGVHFTDKGLLPTVTLKKAGYQFKGWKQSDTDISMETSYDSLVQDDSIMSITLVAQWEIDQKPIPAKPPHHESNNAVPSTGDSTNIQFLILLAISTLCLLIVSLGKLVKILYTKKR